MTPRSGAVRPDPTADIDGYLARLGLERPALPDLAWLFAAHRAHMERIPYENLEIQLERATSVDPAEAIARIARGRGGYCFHMNGALGTLLATLGYDVTRHLGEVRGAERDQASTDLTINHQVLTVLCEGETWFVDCGLGDAPYEPMVLRAGTVATQGAFTYGFEPWAGRPGGWRFVHDPNQESFVSMVFAPEPVGVAAFAAAHHRLSTSPDSNFVRAAVASRRDARGTDIVRGRVLYRVDGDGVTKQTIDTPDSWYELLADVFGLHLSDVDAAERAVLWKRVSAAHEEWLAERAAAR
ncbi:arylamine N-acetyltransferase family protein [Actinospica sp.]|uniref:arylamine N-acetyltransferase family protein n=1 Tax=Actinospica sp. TaxID=1872142 RepID=UPI002D16954F|nr:arylamine N-acetyltransferase [Actinospica sp.]HWG23355.1 arylamine N-acetyltransferase [Actinospica sp.]